ncbi:MAG: bifunctional phosphoribosylaminoimidazolecarboxamide formyltransferase/inosine monophosphate cyclohydrolase [Candidatus Zixiibacteriota bacterium]|nr:MAG: bifunctional phosphoribosylaminoimidazolecarboxamide formyltransferase/inosine monophosphate cyclohydrolase [candidate division Zixibacteria bacterium]
MADTIKIRRALISVSNKTGVVELAKVLEAQGVEILSTGGTLKVLRDAGVHVISVPTFTGSPEVMGGRVKTLHPRIHAGLLYRRGNAKDEEELAQLESKPIDLVIVNLYPFKETVARADATHEEIVENIDIGGPSMLRSAAKNYTSVTVVVDSADYQILQEELESHECATTPEFRQRCAAKAFELTAQYEAAIASYFGSLDDGADTQFPEILTRSYRRRSSLRYGENPHQEASVYEEPGFSAPNLLSAKILSGKELSYNNFSDLEACLDMILDFSEPFACLLKHANPCGAAVGSTLVEAYRRAYECDPLSAFGCIIGLNREVDLECAEELHKTQFVECMLAPSFTDEAFKLLKKKKARRILTLSQITDGRGEGEMVYRFIRGGLLAQTADAHELDPGDLKVVTKRPPTDDELQDLLFAWKAVKHTKSNAIVLAKNRATVGIGMGQTSRVDSGFMAVKRAGERAKGAVMASDAFYPMPDGVEVGTDAGVTAIIQPGGSKGDQGAIDAADKAGATMVFTGVRHFKH